MQTISRDEHNISRKHISPAALKVIYQLNEAGFESYLVGGGVRDLLLNGRPKDFDVATNATPEQVRNVFRNSRIIGRRFKIVHVRFGRELIEVTTFRGDSQGKDAPSNIKQKNNKMQQSDEGMLLRDNVYGGTIEDDAMRRDFTINALYYTVQGFAILDFCNGVNDLEQQQIRMIGDPETRYREDPVRMLRAARFAAKLNFEIEPRTADPIHDLGYLLGDISSARLFDETLKLLMGGYGQAVFTQLQQLDLFSKLFPATQQCIDNAPQRTAALIEEALKNTDRRIAQEKPVTPAFIYAALLWPVVQQLVSNPTNNTPPSQALQQAADHAIRQQITNTAIPKRFSIAMREIWDMQIRLEDRPGKRVYSILGHPRFRASYDFLLLREQAGESLSELCQWWTEIQNVDDDKKESMIEALGKQPKKRRRKPKKKDNPSVDK